MGRLRSSLVLAVLAAAVFTTPTLHSQNKATNYLVLVTSQNPSATAAVAADVAARGTVVAELGAIGIVTATSTEPNFSSIIAGDPNVQGVAVDPEVPWLPPNERVIPGDFAGNVPPVGRAKSFTRPVPGAGAHWGPGLRGT